jgi:RNA polymerase sigma-70 factor (ECF subfamily)
MHASDDFHALVSRVRAGNPDAAAELLRQYEPEVRRFVHMRLTHPGMRRVLDSTDICQSVFAAFYVRVGVGAYDELGSPKELVALLVQMAKHRINHHYQKITAQKRDHERVLAGNDEALQAVADDAPSPSQVIVNRDLLAQVLNRLPERDRYLAEQRMQDRPWGELARELDESPDGLRMRLRRAVQEACLSLGIEEYEQ